MTPAAGVHPMNVCGQLTSFHWCSAVSLSCTYLSLSLSKHPSCGLECNFPVFLKLRGAQHAALCSRTCDTHATRGILSEVNVWCLFVAAPAVLRGLSMPQAWDYVSFSAGHCQEFTRVKKYFMLGIYKSVGPLSPLRDLLGCGVYLLLTPASFFFSNGTAA